MIPVLHTNAITLRGPRLSDYPAWKAFWATGRAVHTDHAKGPAAAWCDFATGCGLWLIRSFGCWAIEDRATGCFIGMVGMSHPAHFPEPELGWILMAEAEGMGIAHAAAQAALGSVWANTTLPTVVSTIDPRNHRSIPLAERLGAVLDAGAARHDPADLVYRHGRAA